MTEQEYQTQLSQYCKAITALQESNHEWATEARKLRTENASLRRELEAYKADKVTIKLRTNEDMLGIDEAVWVINSLRKKLRAMKSEGGRQDG